MIRWAWLLVALASSVAIGWRFEPVVDLTWFLPTPSGVPEQVLIERLGQGPGSQLLFVSLDITDGADAYAVSDAAKKLLEASGYFHQVSNGQFAMGQATLPPVIWDYRYQLTDLQLDDAGLHAMLADRQADVMTFADPWFIEMVAADPAFAAVNSLEGISPVSADDLQWVKADGTSTTIIVETIAPAFALAEQETAINFIRNLQLLGMQQITVHGMGAYGVDLQTTIRREATLRSIAATVMALLILFAAYRRPLALLAGILPLLLGALSGLAVIALLFGKIHGITLAFGFTLIGVAIDYPLHLLSHLRGSDQGREVASIWKTMRIGVISTLAAYAAIAAGGSSGLAQMGIFSATGILVAYLATRTLLPDLLGIKTGPAEPATYSLEPILDQRIWLAVLVAGMVMLITVATPHWTNDLSVVSPVAPEKIAEDQRLREQFGAPDIRSLLVLRNPEQQQVLLQTEALAATLELQVEAGTLQAFQTVSQLVPSHARQKERLIQIQAASLTTERLNTIARQYGFRNGAFDAFSNKLSSITAAPTLLDASAYSGTSLDNVVTGSLYFENDEWVSLVTLYGLQDAGAFQANLDSAFPAATYVNLKDASQSLMERYRYRVLTMLLLASGAIIVYLTWSLGLRRRTLWVLGTLAAAQVLTLTAGALLLGSLSVFNLIAAVLVAGLGLDYALFYARAEQNETTRQNTSHAVTVCALSTCAAFTILALSSIPVLQSIGVTASIGVAASYLLARFGRKPG